jgi:hypothetical protein
MLGFIAISLQAGTRVALYVGGAAAAGTATGWFLGTRKRDRVRVVERVVVNPVPVEPLDPKAQENPK